MKRVLVASVVVGMFLVMAAYASARKWTSRDGKFSVDADLVSVADGKVKLKKADGGLLTVPVDRLSQADQDFLANASAPAAPAKEISYTNDIHPFMVKCCVDCHRQKKARGGVRLEKYADMIKKGKKGIPVIAGKPAESRVIFTHAGGKEHPAKDSEEAEEEDKNTKAVKPTEAELAMLEKWIKDGAKDDTPAKP